MDWRTGKMYWFVSEGATLHYKGAVYSDECFATLKRQPTFAPEACVYWQPDRKYTPNLFKVSSFRDTHHFVLIIVFVYEEVR